MTDAPKTKPEPESRAILPGYVKLAAIARELDVLTHTLVEASQRGRFVPLVQVGRTWFAKVADVQAWFARDHANTSAIDLDRVRAAGAAACPPMHRRSRR